MVDVAPNFVPDAVLLVDLFRDAGLLVIGVEVFVGLDLGELDLHFGPCYALDSYGTELARDSTFDHVAENVLVFADYMLMRRVETRLGRLVDGHVFDLGHSGYCDAGFCYSVFSTRGPPFQVEVVSDGADL